MQDDLLTYPLCSADSTTSNILPNASGSANRCSVPTSINADEPSPLFLTSSSESANGTVSSDLECRMVVLGFTLVAVPQVFYAGQSRTSGVVLESIFIATALPRELPTTTSG